ncbi:pyridoxal phosphate-dependent transferase [Podospora fimiseda]|uniref:Pyridoxal phosphate-dependent transferase n=1 Tax=Podospora fimiseda TaxID=252190 RepID=A0AAN7BMB0_9PEZI|nr:pyridoxal phosphate-dependent transferase [Podospora fimiseda]
MSQPTNSHDATHAVISSLFIGPRAENMNEFRDNILAVLDELQDARQSYFDEDAANGFEFIPQAIRETQEFKRSTLRTATAVRETAKMLAKHSIPFWSPRYQAHMCTDLTMPAVLGYMITMLYNPNNVAIEASPLTTIAEIEVGEQLCDLFGFQNNPTNKNEPKAWGHVTCDGTVANLESVWVSRNLKFYPLSLRKAMDDPDGPLRFVPDTFSVRTCQGRLKKFRELTTWELLNLKLKTILDIPERLEAEFGITPKWLEGALNSYNIQTTGKDVLERQFNVSSPQLLVASTKHYSWPKSSAIMGIGSENTISVGVDNEARVDMGQLERLLEERLAKQQAVYTVVAVIGSTEEGAVDPLGQILALRQRFQARGLSFLVHGDAAWGGYFATMLPRGPATTATVDPSFSPVSINDANGAGLSGRDGGLDGLVPDLPLRVETQEDLFALRFCDSVTVDPHKAGYVPYPAGALTYRDGRIRNLVTWTSPYLSQGSVTSIGIFGVEGSKPGASAVSTWLSNKCVGLDQNGYGALLSEACFTSARISALWAALTTEESSFLCVPFNPIPSEKAGDSKIAQEEERARIRTEILTKSNTEILAADAAKPPGAPKTMALLRALGSDLNINAFAINWKYEDGTPNKDVTEANYFMTRVVSKLSVDNPDDKPTEIPLYLTSTKFEHEYYGECAQNYKRRLHLDDSSHEELMVLRNVVMSPLATFTTNGDFINMLGKIFTEVVDKEVQVMRARNDSRPDYHSFLTRGTEGKIFLSYRPMFHLAKHRLQTILEVAFVNKKDEQIYRQLKQNSEEEIVFKTSDKIDLLKLLAAVKPGQKSPELQGNLTTKSNGTILSRAKVQILSILKNRPLSTVNHDEAYPSGYMPFYIYGSTLSTTGTNTSGIVSALQSQTSHFSNLSLSGSVNLPLLPSSSGQISIGGNHTHAQNGNGTTTTASSNQTTSTSQELHIDHILTRSPNIILSSSIDFIPNDSFGSQQFPDNAILILEGIHEAAMQPFADPPSTNLEKFFFRAGAEFQGRIYADTRAVDASAKGLLKEVLKGGKVLSSGRVVIREDREVTVDVEKVNRDPWREEEEDRVGRWRERWGRIGREMDSRTGEE